jgi:hypothetical protein
MAITTSIAPQNNNPTPPKSANQAIPAQITRLQKTILLPIIY